MTVRNESAGLRIEGLTPSTVLTPHSPLAPVLHALVTGDEEVTPEAGAVRVSTTRLRSWPDDLLRGLGVTRFTGRLIVEEEGLVGNPRYRWRLAWDDRPGTVEGPWLERDGARYLLDEALQAVVALADEVAGQPRVDVFRRIVRLVQLSERDPRIEPARRLLSRTILEADGVRLTLEEGPDGRPLPVPHLVHLCVGEAEPLPLDATTLERAAAQALAHDSVVALGKDRYLVVTAAAARNATLSLAARRAAPELRRKFVDNPLAYLPDEVAFDEKDYSERVIGVGEAPRRAAAEAPSATRDWAGEAGGLLVQTEGGELFVPSEELEAFHDALQGAVEAGAAQVSWDGREVPATQPVLDAVQRVLREPPGGPADEGERRRPRVLLIAENEVVLDWAPAPDAVRVVRTRSLPPLTVSLQPHQRDALRRLQDLWRDGGTGALLCDDMGLGKTLQALVFAAWAADQLRDGRRSDRDSQDGPVDIPVCIVAPPSLLEGWLAEIGRRFGPETFPRVLWGQSQRPSMSPRGLEPLSRFLHGGRGRDIVLEDVRVDSDALRAYRPDVLLIGYDTLRRLQFAVGQIRSGCSSPTRRTRRRPRTPCAAGRCGRCATTSASRSPGPRSRIPGVTCGRSATSRCRGGSGPWWTSPGTTR